MLRIKINSLQFLILTKIDEPCKYCQTVQCKELWWKGTDIHKSLSILRLILGKKTEGNKKSTLNVAFIKYY